MAACASDDEPYASDQAQAAAANTLIPIWTRDTRGDDPRLTPEALTKYSGTFDEHEVTACLAADGYELLVDGARGPFNQVFVGSRTEPVSWTKEGGSANFGNPQTAPLTGPFKQFYDVCHAVGAVMGPALRKEWRVPCLGIAYVLKGSAAASLPDGSYRGVVQLQLQRFYTRGARSYCMLVIGFEAVPPRSAGVQSAKRAKRK